MGLVSRLGFGDGLVRVRSRNLLKLNIDFILYPKDNPKLNLLLYLCCDIFEMFSSLRFLSLDSRPRPRVRIW